MALSDGSIMTDEPELDIDDAAAQLLEKWTIKKPTETVGTPSPPPDEGEMDEHALAAREEEQEEHEEKGEDDEGEEKTPAQLAADDHEVVVSVDGQEHRIAVKDLKRLYGQEASLTQKSQQVSERLTQAQNVAVRHATALDGMLQRAQERLKPYAQVDWALAAAKLPAEDYQQLKAAHDALKSDVDYYTTELEGVIKTGREENTKAAEKAADDCVAALTDPESNAFIEGFSEPLYQEIRQYAVDVGVPQQLIDQTYDPVAIKLIHKAMLYDKAQKTATKKLTNAPRNINKTPTNSGGATRTSAGKAMEKLRASGDEDDAAAVLVARWSA